MKTARALNKTEKGMLLFVAIFLMLVLFMIGCSFVSLICNDYFTSNMGISTTEVFWFADAGVDYMIEVIRAQGIYSPYIPLDASGYQNTGTGWGPEIYSPELVVQEPLVGRFRVVAKLYSPDDWRGRGMIVGTHGGLPTSASYPDPPGIYTPYPLGMLTKFRPYLVSNGEPLRDDEAKLNRIVIQSMGFMVIGHTLPVLPQDTEPFLNKIMKRKRIKAIYSMTTEELEIWTEFLH